MRNVIAVAAALLLAAVPGALAATETIAPAGPLVERTATDRPVLHHEARAQLGDAQRHAERKLAAKRRAALPDVTVPPQLEAIAECESHGNPRSIGGGGLYRGKYQMTTSIWAAVGGKGDPAAASEEEQDRRAALLYQRSGPGQWPHCGQ